MAKNLGNIGNVYAASGLDLDAIGYYRSELAIQKGKYDSLRLFIVNSDIGKAFLDINNYDSTRSYLNDASFFLNPKFGHLHSMYYINQAEFYFKEEQDQMADSLIELTMQNAQETQDGGGYRSVGAS